MPDIVAHGRRPDVRAIAGLQEARMEGSKSIGEIVRVLIDDPEYRTAFTARLEARTVDPAIVERLIAYARARQATKGQAIARKVLTDAGVSWEAL